MTLIGQDVILSEKKILGNYWNQDDLYGEHHPFIKKCLAECNDGFMVDARRFLKADGNRLDAFLYRISHNPERTAVVNYLANHDSLTLWDMVCYEHKHNEANGEGGRDGAIHNHTWNCGVEGETKNQRIRALRMRQVKNALIMLCLSQGTPMILAGDEMGRTKKGNNNTYCQDNELSWLNWKVSKKGGEIYEFLKELLAFREKHRILHMPSPMRQMDYGSFSCPDMSYHSARAWYPQIEEEGHSIGVMYYGAYAQYCGEPEDDTIYIGYNVHWEARALALPKLPKRQQWYLAIHTGQAPYIFREELLPDDQKSITLPARSTVVLVGREAAQA
jgi:glycogen operon protein